MQQWKNEGSDLKWKKKSATSVTGCNVFVMFLILTFNDKTEQYCSLFNHTIRRSVIVRGRGECVSG